MLELMKRSTVKIAQQALHKNRLAQRIVFRARLESINILKERKSVQIVRLDDQQTL
jgi:hypothetical protein